MPFPLFVFGSVAIVASTMAAVLLLSRWRLAAVASALVGATVLLVFHGPVFFDYYADDAYITLRYSQHLADGLGPNWNSVGRVEGYTSFLWMAVLAGIGKLGFDLVDASRVLSFFALVATFFAVYGIWKLWSDEEKGSGLETPLLLAAVLLGLALTDALAYWGFSGMETPLFMALLTGGAYLYLRERRSVGFPWSAVVFIAAAMTRPEGLIAVAVTGGFVLAEVVQATDRQRVLRRAAVWGGLFLLLYGSYFLWRYSYYDYLLPNTAYAKAELSRTFLDRGLAYITISGLKYHLPAMFAGMAILLSRPRLRRDAAYIIALTGFLLAGVAFEGGDDFRHGRFIIPVLPLLFLGGLAGFAVLLKRSALQPMQVALVASVGLGLAGLSLLPHSLNPFLPREREAREERSLIGAWLNEHTPPDFTIAAYAIGAISYHAIDRDFLDLLGLNDVTIAHTDVPDFGRGLAGHEKYNVDYVLNEVRPEIIITNDAAAQPFGEELLRRKFAEGTPVRARDELLTDPRLWERYQVRSLNIDGRWFNFLQRRDTVAELQGPGLLPP
ncbi:MAG: hypothetical protein IIB21_01070 [Chloroflexi bacterium]|nr:hypothetical protein [Chloroflexota bacterium]